MKSIEVSLKSPSGSAPSPVDDQSPFAGVVFFGNRGRRQRRPRRRGAPFRFFMANPLRQIGFRVAEIRPRRRRTHIGVFRLLSQNVVVHFAPFCFSFVFLVMLPLFL